LHLDDAKDRYFTQFPILGQYVWPNPSPIPNTYAEEIISLKNWMTSRINWMDSNIPGVCDASIDEKENLVNNLTVFPNPFNSNLILTLHLTNPEIISIEVKDVLGQVVLQLNDKEYASGENEIQIDFSDKAIENGMYLMIIQTSKGTITQKIHKSN
jgi:hypothetical protein